MSISLKFYTDAALTTELTTLEINQLFDGSSPDVDKIIYWGSVIAGRVFKATSDPGVDPIVIDIIDASAGAGIEDTNLKLALTSANLDSATAGASLTVGTQVLSGVGNAIAIHARSDTPTLSATDTAITFESNDLTETTV